MTEVADKCIMDAVNATDQYSKWACAERAKNIRASIAEIERLELEWCNGVICFANDKDLARRALGSE
jgi:Ni,Fe-hydrogenase III large subunit